MKKLKARHKNSQAGFTMVELAIVLVIAGILLIGALKGTDMINKAKIERTVSDIRGIQTMIFEHEKRTGKLAGDCDGDGIIEVASADLAVVRLAGDAYDDVVDPTAGQGTACMNSGTQETNINTPWKDLRKANIVEPGRINRQITKNQTNNFYGIGSFAVGTGNAVVPTNVITVYDIPLWMAKGIDVAIDGAGVGGDANANAGAAGRVRLLHDGTTSSVSGASWPTNANDDRLVSISFQFDRSAP